MPLVPIDQIRPSTYNPRTADTERLELVKLSLQKLGFVLPLYVGPSGEILSGHQRHLMAQSLGVREVPVEYTPELDLAARKALNLTFNRATNDLSSKDTPSTITEAITESGVYDMAAQLPDCEPDTPGFNRCLHTQRRSITPYLRANRGRWVRYARNLARVLERFNIRMPIVATPDGMVVNGIGRLERVAQTGGKTIDVVEINQAEADFAHAMLNLLSMDFDLQDRYADLLRYNSFRRARRKRTELGRGFVFALIGNKPSRHLDLSNPAHAEKWRRFYGTHVLDFGAGHLHEADILKEIGVDVTPFEPYRVRGDKIDKAASIAMTESFLTRVRRGDTWQSIFIASVLNSVPFEEDRRHIVTLVAALASPATRVYASASSVSQVGWRHINGADFMNNSDGANAGFALDYEPGIRVGELGTQPKVQKYHNAAEFRTLFQSRFQKVKSYEEKKTNNVEAIATDPRPAERDALRRAIEFEFNLPYPDGTSMDMVEQAKAAFSERLDMDL